MTALLNDPVLAFIAAFWACIVLASLVAAFSLARQSARRYFANAQAAIDNDGPWFGLTDAELMARLRENATVPEQRRRSE